MIEHGCAVCGSRRQRNLLFEYYTTKDSPTKAVVLMALGLNLEQLYEDGMVSRRILCKRCYNLIKTGEIKYRQYAPDWIFGKPRYRYHDQRQINEAKHGNYPHT